MNRWQTALFLVPAFTVSASSAPPGSSV